jgi:hypothetical protein
MVKCGNRDCEAEFEASDSPDSGRTPCPKCSSISRQFTKILVVQFKVQTAIRVFGFLGSKRKWFTDIRSGFSFSHKFQTWMHRLRIFDKRNDCYLERVTNPETGEVVHECSEPLSEHTGHGSAKPKTLKSK